MKEEKSKSWTCKVLSSTVLNFSDTGNNVPLYADSDLVIYLHLSNPEIQRVDYLLDCAVNPASFRPLMYSGSLWAAHTKALITKSFGDPGPFDDDDEESLWLLAKAETAWLRVTDEFTNIHFFATSSSELYVCAKDGVDSPTFIAPFCGKYLQMGEKTYLPSWIDCIETVTAKYLLLSDGHLRADWMKYIAGPDRDVEMKPVVSSSVESLIGSGPRGIYIAFDSGKSRIQVLTDKGPAIQTVWSSPVTCAVADHQGAFVMIGTEKSSFFPQVDAWGKIGFQCAAIDHRFLWVVGNTGGLMAIDSQNLAAGSVTGNSYPIIRDCTQMRLVQKDGLGDPQRSSAIVCCMAPNKLVFCQVRFY